jgi:RNase P subunit RPR2
MRPETLVIELRRLLSRSAELRQRVSAVVHRAAAEVDRADALRVRRQMILSRTIRRMNTITPPLPPPGLKCTECDASLTYEHSFVGGVSDRHREQWDYYRCDRCGAFQYRHRTRKLRHIG